MSNEKPKTINLKLDAETKRKFETLAYLQDLNLQSLMLHLILNAINENAEVIAEAEKLKSKFKNNSS